ncbi:MAG TPA: hypothetical protein VLD85_03115 [Anaeromyxobacteraceae bacterium]|nr:hypothetical protein [Anaeromyxobacteraceae bacterium]
MDRVARQGLVEILVAALLLCACPEERAGTRRQVPAGRVPPAVPVEAPPAPPPGQAPAPAPAAPAPPAPPPSR